MAITVHGAAQRRPSFSEQIGKGFSNAVQGASQFALQQQTQKQETEALNRLTGMDLSGIRHPKILQEATKYALENRGLSSKLSNQKQQQEVVAKALSGQPLSPEEEASLPANVQIQLNKAKQPAKKTQASQPIDEDQRKRINEVRGNPSFEKASASKKYQMFTDNGVSKENAKAEADIYSEEEKLSLEREKEETRKEEKFSAQEFKEKVRVHKESEEYDKQILDSARTAKRALGNAKEAENILARGKVKPSSVVNILGLFGKVGNTLATAIQNEDQAAIKALMPEFLEGKKELFGVRLSDADLKLLQDKSIDIGKSEEANKAILGLIKKYADQSILRSHIASEISKKGEGYRPLGYERLVDEEFDRQTTPVTMIDPKTGMTLAIPAYRVSAAISKGAKILKEE